MEPDHSGAEQTSPRGNDWEVVQLTASTYASAPGPRMSEPSDEAEVKGYGTKGADSAAALLMSGHFSVSQSEIESLRGTDGKERQKELCGQDAVSAEGDDEKFQETCEHKLKDDLHRIPSFDKGKNLSLVDMEFDNGKAFQGMGLVGDEPLGFSSSRYSPIDAKKELSWSVTESKNEKKTEEPTAQNVNRVIDSSKVVASSEQNKPDDSEFPREASWKKQLLSLYKNVRKSNKFWPVVVAATALVGVTYFWRRWQKGKLQHQPVKLYPSSNEKINQAIGPLNRIKDILAANNHPTPAIHGHARLS